MDKQNAGFMARALELAQAAIGQPGAKPYAAVVTRNGQVIGEGINRALARHDPTSHGEIEAIRAACTMLETTDLSGCDLYSSCEPCPICVAVMYRANIRQLYYAASADDDDQLVEAASLHKPGPDDRGLRNRDIANEVATPVGKRKMPSHQLMANEGLSVLVAWHKSTIRTEMAR